jgi:hypothetical protein
MAFCARRVGDRVRRRLRRSPVREGARLVAEQDRLELSGDPSNHERPAPEACRHSQGVRQVDCRGAVWLPDGPRRVVSVVPDVMLQIVTDLEPEALAPAVDEVIGHAGVDVMRSASPGIDRGATARAHRPQAPPRGRHSRGGCQSQPTMSHSSAPSRWRRSGAKPTRSCARKERGLRTEISVTISSKRSA